MPNGAMHCDDHRVGDPVTSVSSVHQLVAMLMCGGGVFGLVGEGLGGQRARIQPFGQGVERAEYRGLNHIPSLSWTTSLVVL